MPLTDNSTGTSDVDLTPLHTVIITVLYSVTIAVALTGNLLLIFIVTRRPETRTLTGFLFLNMAAADLMVTLVVMPLTMAVPYTETKWLPGVIGHITCKAVYYGFHVTIAASILSLAFMSVDRYLAVLFPLRSFSTFRRAKVLSLVIWLISMIVMIPAAVLWINKKYPDGMYCVAGLEEAFGDFQKGALGFYLYLFLLIYLIPLLVIAVLYGLICCRLWRRKMPGLVSSKAEKNHEETKRKVVRTLIMITVAFALCWLPTQTYHLILAFNLQLHFRFPRIVMFMCFWFGHANSALNPWLYMLLTPKYRIALCKLCCGKYYDFRVRAESTMRNTQYSSVRENNSDKERSKKTHKKENGLLKEETEERETVL